MKALASAFLIFGATAALCEPAQQQVATDWVVGYNNKARLVAGRAARDGAQTAVYAGVEIEMPKGWKTYWRAPGDAGGIPPEFDWEGSENLASVEVLYPAPHRLTDKAGDAIGYKDRVLFPIRVTAKDATLPVVINGVVQYGICKDICIPAEAKLQLEVPPAVGPSAELRQALTRVPVAKARAGIDPVLANWRLDPNGGKPKLVLTVESAAAKDVDVFVAAPGGDYIPLPQRADAKSNDTGTAVQFNVDLSDGVDLGALNGKALAVTIVDSRGQSESKITLKTK